MKTLLLQTLQIIKKSHYCDKFEVLKVIQVWET